MQPSTVLRRSLGGGAAIHATPLSTYLATHVSPDSDAVAYIASLQAIAQSSPQIARSIVRELERQRTNIKLIASENYCSLAVQLAMGNLLTDKYAEGYPRQKFYAGNDNVDDIEELAQAEARESLHVGVRECAGQGMPAHDGRTSPPRGCSQGSCLA